MQIAEESPWSREEVDAHFDGFDVPLRLSATDAQGYPHVCSLWFRRDGDRLLCATQSDAWIAQAGFEARAGAVLLLPGASGVAGAVFGLADGQLKIAAERPSLRRWTATVRDTPACSDQPHSRQFQRREGGSSICTPCSGGRLTGLPACCPRSSLGMRSRSSSTR